MKAIAFEDDCAPDARSVFSSEVRSITGHTLEEFKQLAYMFDVDNRIEWHHGFYVLCQPCDEPYHTLYYLGAGCRE